MESQKSFGNCHASEFICFDVLKNINASKWSHNVLLVAANFDSEGSRRLKIFTSIDVYVSHVHEQVFAASKQKRKDT